MSTEPDSNIGISCQGVRKVFGPRPDRVIDLLGETVVGELDRTAVLEALASAAPAPSGRAPMDS